MSRFGKAVMAMGALLIMTSAPLLSAQSGDTVTANGFQIAVNDKGMIRLPKVDYRKDWALLGTFAIAAKEGTAGSQGLHAVYTQRDVVAAYRKTGQFPDGSVLIKELFSTVTEDMTTGTVSRADKTTGWFIMVKDSKNRFAGHKLWGDGWGWAYFDKKNPLSTPTKDYEADCKGCHVPAKNNDWVYTEGYPVLRGQ